MLFGNVGSQLGTIILDDVLNTHGFALIDEFVQLCLGLVTEDAKAEGETVLVEQRSYRRKLSLVVALIVEAIDGEGIRGNLRGLIHFLNFCTEGWRAC